MKPRHTLPVQEWTHLARLGAWSALVLVVLVARAGQADPAAFWSFQPPRDVTPPTPQDRSWPGNEIDQFILARLEKENLAPAPLASKEVLIRRLSFDLTGLPPTPEEVAAFKADSSEEAYPRLVDRLLASAHYGERWGQHWLDVVRFAESEGFEYDRHIPDGWRFRDYVIDSFNADKPYDLFLKEQLAGDELHPDDPVAQVAVQFHRLGAVRRNAGNPEIALSRNEVLTERTDIIGAAFLGLTVGCARCHDHKFDPISQRDYYQLQAFMAASSEHDISLASKTDSETWTQQSRSLTNEIARLKKAMDKAEGEERVQIKKEIAALQKRLPPPLPTIASIINDHTSRTEVHILKRGQWEQKGEAVGMRPPSVLMGTNEPALPADFEHPRTYLAQWLTQADHPLTARVMVNRIWQYHFGTGLVKTANDFGHHGSAPSHPELLDYLALRFERGDWKIKPIHRLILLSKTYRQAAQPSDPNYLKLDPENRWLGHFSRRRLEAEELRDAMLAVSGRLNLKRGGPSVMLPVDAELVNLLYNRDQWVVSPDESEHDRRTIYLMAKRNLRLPFLEVFDQPALQTSCARRESGTHAPQALELLNGATANDLAHAFASRLQKEAGADPSRIIERAFLLCAGRPPDAGERNAAESFLKEQPLSEFALAMFNLNAFLYVQ